MHKTGTTSLHKALTILGYDSAHWKSVRWAKEIWMEMNETPAAAFSTDEATLLLPPRSLTLEQHYALSDLPIPMLFEKLDKSYPGSKFILTLRNEERWLRSVERHWTNSNQFQETWKKENNFPRQLHAELYGQADFDPTVFLARYRRHNEEVLAHFKDRPHDLLVLNMDTTFNKKGFPIMKPDGWPELCAFLDKPVPSEPYPLEFASQAPPRLRVAPPSVPQSSEEQHKRPLDQEEGLSEEDLKNMDAELNTGQIPVPAKDGLALDIQIGRLKAGWGTAAFVAIEIVLLIIVFWIGWELATKHSHVLK
jgi:hypothetical protein